MKKIILFLISSILLLGCSDDSTNPEEQDDFSGDSGTFVDERDGHEYKWVKIGEQIWMAENLRYLPFTEFSREDLYYTSGYYIYDYFGSNKEEAIETDNYKKYGVLYNLTAAKESCPTGWHLPSDNEWEELANYISEDQGGYNKFDLGGTPDYPVNAVDDWELIGDHLKTTYDWKENGSGIDSYGFSILPAGAYMPDNNNDFYGIEEIGAFWSATKADENTYEPHTWKRQAINSNGNLYRKFTTDADALSVRCIKNSN